MKRGWEHLKRRKSDQWKWNVNEKKEINEWMMTRKEREQWKWGKTKNKRRKNKWKKKWRIIWMKIKLLDQEWKKKIRTYKMGRIKDMWKEWKETFKNHEKWEENIQRNKIIKKAL